MKRLMVGFVLVFFLVAPALAETDNYARTLLRNQGAEIATLQTQIKALAVLVESLKSQNAVLLQKVESNRTLIRALAQATATTQTQPSQ